MNLLPFGLYECPKCREKFQFIGEKDGVICPKCQYDLTTQAIRTLDIDPLTEAARRGFESVQHKD